MSRRARGPVKRNDSLYYYYDSKLFSRLKEDSEHTKKGIKDKRPRGEVDLKDILDGLKGVEGLENTKEKSLPNWKTLFKTSDTILGIPKRPKSTKKSISKIIVNEGMHLKSIHSLPQFKHLNDIAKVNDGEVLSRSYPKESKNLFSLVEAHLKTTIDNQKSPNRKATPIKRNSRALPPEKSK